MSSHGALSSAPLSAETSSAPIAGSWSVAPASGHTLGSHVLAAAGNSTTWTGSPFSIVGGTGTATITAQSVSSAILGSITLNVTALGTIILSDGSQSTTYDSRPVVPNAPTTVLLVDNGNGTVTATYTQASDDGGSAITGNHLISSDGATGDASVPGGAILFTVTDGVPVSAQVRASNAEGDGPYSTDSAVITPSVDVDITVYALRHAPYREDDTIGVKTYQIYNADGGAVGSPVTTGFVDAGNGNIPNAWDVEVAVQPTEADGSFAGFMVFSNINGTDKRAVELNIPPTTEPVSLTVCKIPIPWQGPDPVTIVTPGYRLRPMGGIYGSHITSGITAISGVTNGYYTKIVLPPDSNNGAQYNILWDGG